MAEGFDPPSKRMKAETPTNCVSNISLSNFLVAFKHLDGLLNYKIIVLLYYVCIHLELDF